MFMLTLIFAISAQANVFKSCRDILTLTPERSFALRQVGIFGQVPFLPSGVRIQNHARLDDEDLELWRWSARNDHRQALSFRALDARGEIIEQVEAVGRRKGIRAYAAFAQLMGALSQHDRRDHPVAKILLVRTLPPLPFPSSQQFEGINFMLAIHAILEASGDNEIEIESSLIGEMVGPLRRLPLYQISSVYKSTLTIPAHGLSYFSGDYKLTPEYADLVGAILVPERKQEPLYLPL